MKETEILARNVKRYRQDKGLTQSDLATKVGLTKDYISRIEKAKQPNVGLKYLILIHRELGIEMEELFMEEAKFIKLVLSNQNVQSLEKILAEVTRRLEKKEE